jgi:hypothetical protein
LNFVIAEIGGINPGHLGYSPQVFKGGTIEDVLAK